MERCGTELLGATSMLASSQPLQSCCELPNCAAINNCDWRRTEFEDRQSCNYPLDCCVRLPAISEIKTSLKPIQHYGNAYSDPHHWEDNYRPGLFPYRNEFVPQYQPWNDCQYAQPINYSIDKNYNNNNSLSSGHQYPQERCVSQFESCQNLTTHVGNSSSYMPQKGVWHSDTSVPNNLPFNANIVCPKIESNCSLSQDPMTNQFNSHVFGTEVTMTDGSSVNKYVKCSAKKRGPPRSELSLGVLLKKRYQANQQERKRMNKINWALDKLRQRLPSHMYTPRRLSKIKTLTLAINYIETLTQLIDDSQ